MTLAADDFEEFFRAVNDGHPPFRWQRRLLDHLLDQGRWPSHISAPTGSGKSNVVDVHVFANALLGAGVGPRVPRRLSVVVNRRALVDNHYTRAVNIRKALTSADASGAVAAVRDGLVALRSPTVWATGDKPPHDVPAPLVVVELRGGVPRDRGWLDDPSACALIAATPDMWGSRLLMRGYGSRPQAWPREAGLLAYDAAVVVDEAHLNRQLVHTAQRVGQLAAMVDVRMDIPLLQVVDTTATPVDTDAGETVGVVVDDLAVGADDYLARRLTSPKPITLAVSPAWPGKGKVPRSHVDTFVAEVEALLAVRGDDRRAVGCIVNRVETAIKVTEALRVKGFEAAAWVGRRRPMDIDKLTETYPGLFSSADDNVAGLDVLVATQTVEVGIDLDLHSLVTELASGSALVQRAGRVNRIGRADFGSISIVVPNESAKVEDYLPYTATDLVAALDWVRRRAEDPAGLAPWAVDRDRPPIESPRRVLLQRAEPYDAWWWAQTSESLFAEVDLGLFLRDELERETASGGLVVRDFASAIHLPGDQRPDQTDIIALLNETPPVAQETFDVPLGQLRTLVERALTETPGLVFVFRRGAVDVLLGEDETLPGDVIVVSTSFRCFTAGVPTGGGADAIVGTRWGERGVEPAPAEMRRAFAGMSPKDAQDSFGDAGKQVVLPLDSETRDDLPWVMLKPNAAVQDDTETLQATGLAGAVSLEQHQSNVEARARDLASSVGLPAEIVDALALAGLLHDEGKRDTRFQQGLAAPADEVLAKSARRNAQQVRRDWARAALRTGWRHEQLSAAVAYARGDAARDLVARLAGTSHGRGRGVFDHPPFELNAHKLGSEVAAAAETLFGVDAQWERLTTVTHERWGVWGCAYLEAILRAADCQVSREGS